MRQHGFQTLLNLIKYLGNETNREMKITKQERVQVWGKYNHKCAYCGEDLEFSKMQVDHIHPKYLGGKDEIENLNPSCRQCNFYKGTYTIDHFRTALATLRTRIQKSFIVRLGMKYGIVSIKQWDGLFYFEKIEK